VERLPVLVRLFSRGVLPLVPTIGFLNLWRPDGVVDGVEKRPLGSGLGCSGEALGVDDFEKDRRREAENSFEPGLALHNRVDRLTW
jgi:hypothetical protein